MDMSREPSWVAKISSKSVCTYFYVMFLLIAAAAGIVVLWDLWQVVSSGGRRGFHALYRSVLMFTLPVLNALFMYILCARSLLEK